MDQCVAQTGEHRRCTRMGNRSPDGSPHLHMCGTHLAQHMVRVNGGAGAHPAGRCLHATRRHNQFTWCADAPVDGSAYCAAHAPWRDAADAAVAEFHLGDAEIRAWAELQGAHVADDRMADFRVWAMAQGLHIVVDGPAAAGAGPPPALPPPALGVLALDTQNVHTGVVNRVTEEGISRLCAIEIPRTQDTRRSILHAFTAMDVQYESLMTVWRDIEYWWRVERCRAPAHLPPDMLYRITLRGLVAYIERVESAETRTELYRRLYQEALESVGMCCDGHMARLVNVLVGFDDAFRPPVSQGELIQNRIAAIAALEGVSVEERQRQANAFFDEIAYPAADRAAWIDVLAE